MEEKINKALNIIITFDWTWRMDDNNYNQNLRKAQSMTKSFMDILKEINDKEIVKALRDLWIAHYDLSQPFREADYYAEKKKALKDAESHISNLLNNLREHEGINCNSKRA